MVLVERNQLSFCRVELDQTLFFILNPLKCLESFFFVSSPGVTRIFQFLSLVFFGASARQRSETRREEKEERRQFKEHKGPCPSCTDGSPDVRCPR